MVMATETSDLTLEASDVSGERVMRISGISRGATAGELVQELVSEIDLPRADVEGRPLTYHARLDREGRHLHASEIVGDALEPGDRLTLQPQITAGAGF